MESRGFIHFTWFFFCEKIYYIYASDFYSTLSASLFLYFTLVASSLGIKLTEYHSEVLNVLGTLLDIIQESIVQRV